MSEGCVCSHSRRVQDHPALSGTPSFARDQRLRLETPGWRVLDFDGNPLPEDELERHREKILLAPLVVRDREHPFREDLIPSASGNVDPQLPMLEKVSCFIDALRLGGSYELARQKTVGEIRPNSQPNQFNRCLVSR